MKKLHILLPWQWTYESVAITSSLWGEKLLCTLWWFE